MLYDAVVLAAFTPIRQVFQSDGQDAIWRFESSQPSHADVSEWQ